MERRGPGVPLADIVEHRRRAVAHALRAPPAELASVEARSVHYRRLPPGSPDGAEEWTMWTAWTSWTRNPRIAVHNVHDVHFVHNACPEPGRRASPGVGG